MGPILVPIAVFGSWFENDMTAVKSGLGHWPIPPLSGSGWGTNAGNEAQSEIPPQNACHTLSGLTALEETPNARHKIKLGIVKQGSCCCMEHDFDQGFVLPGAFRWPSFSVGAVHVLQGEECEDSIYTCDDEEENTGYEGHDEIHWDEEGDEPSEEEE
ncbi:hypothetical protein B0H17DRAFT_1133932 [Mycena rosella]|uniref:Uncharacterized protein n=1 Tax=Mycena rosella TaxID=1033263 RepID=A0AAD7DJQ1_MYCRO|nr:hypothetical protein B0H17DRAFT_1133932 [Mycena rosella]